MVRKFLKKVRSTQAGMVLPLVLILLCVVSFMIIPGLQTATGSLAVNSMVQQRTTAYYAADAGIAAILWKFNHEPTFTLPSDGAYYDLPDDINGMKVRVSRVSYSPTTKTYVIQSTAKQDGVPKSDIFASIEVIPGSGGGGSGNMSAFQFALATTGGNINLTTQNVLVTSANNKADLYANGNLVLNNADVNGAGYYAPGKTSSGCANVLNECTSRAGVILETAQWQNYWDEVSKGLAYSKTGWPAPTVWPTTVIPSRYTGTRTYTINNQTVNLGGPYTTYIDGNLELKSQGYVILKGVVWVNGWILSNSSSSFTADPVVAGDQCYLIARSPNTSEGNYSIIINSNTNMNADGNLNLMAENGGVWLKGNMRNDQGGYPKMGTIYAPDGKIFSESNNKSEWSAMIGKSIEIRSNCIIDYDEALRTGVTTGSVVLKKYSAQ
jgi:Tfp pilus assembly protein PilX